MKNYCYQNNKYILTQIFQFENCELFKIFGLNQSLYHFLFFKKTIPTSPKQTPPKTTTRDLRIKAMISMD